MLRFPPGKGNHQADCFRLPLASIIIEILAASLCALITTIDASAAVCGGRVMEVPGLREAGDWIPERRFLRKRNRVDRTDFIELRYPPKEPGKLERPITVSAGDNDDHTKNCSNETPGEWNKSSQLAATRRPRLPVSLLEHARQLTFTIPEEPAKTLGLCEDGKPKINTAKGQSWNSAAALFTALGFQATLIKDPPRWALPGDELLVTVSWKFYTGSSDSGAESYNISQTRTRVGADGFVSLPLLATPTPAKADSEKDTKIAQKGDKGLSYISVWRPGDDLAKQPILQDVETCISHRLVTRDPSSACLVANIDSGPFFDPITNKNILRVQYRIEPIQTWSVVFEESSRLNVPYVPGETLRAALSRLHLEYFGQTLNKNEHDVYATVIPRKEYGQDLSTPFWAKLVDGQDSKIDDIVPFPGDNVHISCGTPW